MRDTDPPYKALPVPTTVDLAALLHTLRESKVTAREFYPDHGTIDSSGCRPRGEGLPQDVVMKMMLDRGLRRLGDITSREFFRDDGDVRPEPKSKMLARQYSLYAMHPDTAEEIMAMLRFLIEKVGPQLHYNPDPVEYAPKPKRNKR